MGGGGQAVEFGCEARAQVPQAGRPRDLAAHLTEERMGQPGRMGVAVGGDDDELVCFGDFECRGSGESSQQFEG